MTLQVGMVGTDGIVIASDTKWVQQNRIPRIQFNTSKTLLADSESNVSSVHTEKILSGNCATRDRRGTFEGKAHRGAGSFMRSFCTSSARRRFTL
jgi:hypothetical protein